MTFLLHLDLLDELVQTLITLIVFQQILLLLFDHFLDWFNIQNLTFGLVSTLDQAVRLGAHYQIGQFFIFIVLFEFVNSFPKSLVVFIFDFALTFDHF